MRGNLTLGVVKWNVQCSCLLSFVVQPLWVDYFVLLKGVVACEVPSPWDWTSPGIMRRDPRGNMKGVFTTQVLVDMLVYGTIMGTCALSMLIHHCLLYTVLAIIEAPALGY